MGWRERTLPVGVGLRVVVGLDNGRVMAMAKSEATGRVAASPAALDARSADRVRGVACDGCQRSSGATIASMELRENHISSAAVDIDCCRH